MTTCICKQQERQIDALVTKLEEGQKELHVVLQSELCHRARTRARCVADRCLCVGQCCCLASALPAGLCLACGAVPLKCSHGCWKQDAPEVVRKIPGIASEDRALCCVSFTCGLPCFLWLYGCGFCMDLTARTRHALALRSAQLQERVLAKLGPAIEGAAGLTTLQLTGVVVDPELRFSTVTPSGLSDSENMSTSTGIVSFCECLKKNTSIQDLTLRVFEEQCSGEEAKKTLISILKDHPTIRRADVIGVFGEEHKDALLDAVIEGSGALEEIVLEESAGSGSQIGQRLMAAASTKAQKPAGSFVRMPGDRVEGLFKDGRWYDAVIAESNSDGTFLLSWYDDDSRDRRKSAHELRPLKAQYCGRQVGKDNYHHDAHSLHKEPSACTCDGVCGPTNACQCVACYYSNNPKQGRFLKNGRWYCGKAVGKDAYYYEGPNSYHSSKSTCTCDGYCDGIRGGCQCRDCYLATFLLDDNFTANLRIETLLNRRLNEVLGSGDSSVDLGQYSGTIGERRASKIMQNLRENGKTSFVLGQWLKVTRGGYQAISDYVASHKGFAHGFRCIREVHLSHHVDEIHELLGLSELLQHGLLLRFVLPLTEIKKESALMLLDILRTWPRGDKNIELRLQSPGSVVDLSRLKLDSKAAAVLARGLPHHKGLVKFIDLTNNLIDDTGAISLLDAIKHQDDLVIDLRANPVDSELLADIALYNLRRSIAQDHLADKVSQLEQSAVRLLSSSADGNRRWRQSGWPVGLSGSYPTVQKGNLALSFRGVTDDDFELLSEKEDLVQGVHHLSIRGNCLTSSHVILKCIEKMEAGGSVVQSCDLRLNHLKPLEAARLFKERPELFLNLIPQFSGTPVPNISFDVDDLFPFFEAAKDLGPNTDAIIFYYGKLLECYRVQPKDIERRMGEVVPPPNSSNESDDAAIRSGGILDLVQQHSSRAAAEGLPEDFINLAFTKLSDQDAKEVALFLEQRTQPLRCCLWGNLIGERGAERLIEASEKHHHDLDLRWNPLGPKSRRRLAFADPTRYSYMLEGEDWPEEEPGPDHAETVKVFKALAKSEFHDPSGHLFNDLTCLLPHVESDELVSAFAETVANLEAEGKATLMKALKIDRQKRHWQVILDAVMAVLPPVDVVFDIVQMVNYYRRSEWQFLSLLLTACSFNGLASAASAAIHGRPAREMALNLLTLGAGGVMLESRRSSRTGVASESLMQYKFLEAVESSVSWGVASYTLLISGYLEHYGSLTIQETALKCVSVSMSLLLIPKLGYEASWRNMSTRTERSKRTATKVLLASFHFCDLTAQLVLFPLQLATRPIGIFIYISLVLFGIAFLGRLQMVPFPEVLVRSPVMMITAYIQKDSRLAAWTHAAVELKAFGLLAAWAVVLYRCHEDSALASRLLQPDGILMLFLAAVALVGLIVTKSKLDRLEVFSPFWLGSSQQRRSRYEPLLGRSERESEQTPEQLEEV